MGTMLMILLSVALFQALSFVLLAIIVPRWLDRVEGRRPQRLTTDARPGPLLL